jgi:hypothetical protein
MLEDHIALLKYKSRIAYRRIQYKMPVPFDDCLGEAYVIFCKALIKYDPNRGAAFKTYLTHQLRNLENKILIANRMSSIDAHKVFHPSELKEHIADKPRRIPTEELTKDGSLIVSLLLNGVIGGDYGSGQGKRLPGKKRIPPYMRKHFGWSYRKTETVIDEIKDWWSDVL